MAEIIPGPHSTPDFSRVRPEMISKVLVALREPQVTRAPENAKPKSSTPDFSRVRPEILKTTLAVLREPQTAQNPAEYVPADELVRDFKQVAFETRAHDVWGKIEKSLPRDTVNPIHALIKARAKESRISLSEEETVALTNRYKTLREKAGLSSFDRDLNHWALINFFLRREGVIGKKPTNILSLKQRAARWAAAGMAALTLGTTASEALPKIAAGLIAPPILSAQTIPKSEESEQTPTQTISLATLAMEKPTFYIPGTNTPAEVKITNKDLQVLKPAGNGRFLVETDRGTFEIPFGDIQLKEILWNRGREPLPWLGFDCEYPQLTEKIPQNRSGYRQTFP